MSDTKEPSDLENTIEDALGFNFRSLRTLRDILLKPNKVFKSYADGDRMTYTPALRIWLGLLSLTFLILILAGGYGELLKDAFKASPESEESLRTIFGDQVEEGIDKTASIATALQAPFVGLLTALSVFILKPFNPNLTLIARLNITFATLSAGTLAGAITSYLIAIGIIPISSILPLFIIWLVYFVTFWRGAPGVLAQTRSGTIVKALIFSLAVIMLVIIANILNSGISFMSAAITIRSGG